MLRIVIFTLFVLFFATEHAFAFDLDMTVDDDIRKNYNSTKLVHGTNTEDAETLPDLPLKLKNESSNNINLPKQIKPVQNKAPSKIISEGNIKIAKGTSFNVTNVSKISDWQKAGTSVKFKTSNSINKKHFVIPANTVFNGEIIESHQPQISCNGGLVVIRIRSISYSGQTFPVNAYVTRAGGKMIFLNNIKGERTYLKTMWKKGSWGRALFNKMLTLTINLGGEGSTLLLSPFPIAYGTICLGLNAISSPVTAFFSKGKHVSVPAGSMFRIKLLEDAYID